MDLQWIRVLAQAIQAWAGRQARPQAHVLTLEHQRCGRSVKEHLATAGANHREAERALHIFELQVGVARRAVALGAWTIEDCRWDLVDLFRFILNEDVEALIYKAC